MEPDRAYAITHIGFYVGVDVGSRDFLRRSDVAGSPRVKRVRSYLSQRSSFLSAQLTSTFVIASLITVSRQVDQSWSPIILSTKVSYIK